MAAPIPDYSKVSLLLPLSGINNGTVFTDKSPGSRVVTRFGNVITSTAQSKYYGSSGFFDGSGDYLTIPNHADFAFGSGDFTIALWVRMSSNSSFQYLLSKYNISSDQRAWAVSTTNNGKFRFLFSDSGSSVTLDLTDSSTYSLGDWHHVAATRSGSAVRLFVNGVKVAEGSNANAVFSESNPVYVANNIGGVFYFTGYMQDIVVIKGSALWVSDFTPPTRMVGTISGVVTDDVGANAIRNVVGFPRTYPASVSQTTSASDGTYSLSSIPATEYSVVFLDDDAGTQYNDLVLGRVIPV